MTLRERIFTWVLNGLTLLIALLAVVFLIRGYLRPLVEPSLPQGPHVGSQVNLPGVNRAANESTLVLALQVGCHWCESSAGFYRDLIRSNSKGAVHLLAVLPQPIQQDQQFLRSLSLELQDVRQVNLATLNVYATPTLLLLGGDGRIKKVWMGMLSPDGEADVFSTLGLARVQAPSEKSVHAAPLLPDSPTDPGVPNLISSVQMIRLRQHQKVLPIIDVRPLPEFQKGHIAQSINIPQDEFEARFPHEVPKGVTVVLYCHYCAPCETQKESEGVATYCKVSEQWAEKLGYSQVKILSDDLERLQMAGIQIAGSPAEQFVSGSTPVRQ
jgi:hypothetical protein